MSPSLPAGKTALLKFYRASAKEWKGEHHSYAEVKLDGFRMTIIIEGGHIGVYGRQPQINLWSKLSRNLEFREKVEKLPLNSMLDGELFVMDGTSGDAANAIANGGGWDFNVFSMPFFCGRSLSALSWDKVQSMILDEGFSTPPRIEKMDREGYFKLIDELGIEGLMLKQTWLSGWFKLKKVNSIDCVCVGVFPGKTGTRREKLLGSIDVAVFDGDILQIVSAIGKGFTDSDGLKILESPRDYIGKVCEIEFDSISQNGKLVFSRLKRWRDDKPARECTIDQIRSFTGRSFARGEILDSGEE